MNSENIKSLMREHIPYLQSKQLMIKKLSGLTNVTSAIYVDYEPLFIFKTFSNGFDREMENKIVQALSDLELSPLIIFANDTYRIEEFLINTRHPTNADFNDFSLVERIIKHMYVFHQVPHASNQITLSDFMFSPQQKLELQTYKKQKSKSTPGNWQLLQLVYSKIQGILSKSHQLARRLLPTSNSSIRLCHNDLNNLNILFASEKMHFIDYDYVGRNYLAFDIANFINQTSIDYSVGGYPGFKNIKVYNAEEIATFAKMYPGYYSGLEMEVLKFMCISNLFWAIWSIKRYSINKCQDFGVAEHGMMRVELYEKYLALVGEVSRQNSW